MDNLEHNYNRTVNFLYETITDIVQVELHLWYSDTLPTGMDKNIVGYAANGIKHFLEITDSIYTAGEIGHAILYEPSIEKMLKIVCNKLITHVKSVNSIVQEKRHIYSQITFDDKENLLDLCTEYIGRCKWLIECINDYTNSRDLSDLKEISLSIPKNPNDRRGNRFEKLEAFKAFFPKIDVVFKDCSKEEKGEIIGLITGVNQVDCYQYVFTRKYAPQRKEIDKTRILELAKRMNLE